MLSLITTCKNRLPHLKQTLPLMLQQPRAEVIVVDYGCEQGTAAWVKKHHPAARLVQVNDDPVFCAARARNIGAGNASGEILCFVDADVLVHLELGKWLELNQNTNGFYVYPEIKTPELAGFLIVAREHFFKIDGYDEAIRGWGGEDFDLYERLARIGLSQSSVPRDSISPIPHSDELRQLNKDEGGFGGRGETVAMHELYRAIKRDSWQLTGREIELEKRKELFQFIRMKREAAVAGGQNSFEILINVPMHSKYSIYLRGHRGLSYTVTVKPPNR
jgi:glycosyltransferase involved in cell wall biosynthesis